MNPITLFINGRPVSDNTAFPPLEPSDEVIAFVLKRTDANRAVWAELLGSPGFAAEAKAGVVISVGLANGAAVPSVATVALNRWPPARTWIGAAIAVVVLAVFFGVVAKSDALRDNGVTPLRGRRPFSLARVTAAFWLLVLIASYLFISVITADFLNSFTGVAAAIAFIASGTAAFSAYISASKESDPARAALEEFISQCDQALADLAANKVPATALPQPAARTGRIGTLQNALDDIIKPLSAAATPADYPAARLKLQALRDRSLASRSFLYDILSDADGVAFHRFQLAAWTAVLGTVFLYLVWRDLAMPPYNPELLALLGVSSGTYLGMNIPEPAVSRPT